MTGTNVCNTGKDPTTSRSPIVIPPTLATPALVISPTNPPLLRYAVTNFMS